MIDDIVRLLSGLLTPLVAVFVAFIAWQQFKTARDKLRLDLFDRRYRVYRALMELFTTIHVNGTATLDDVGRFGSESDQKRFLFGDDVSSYLTEVRHKAVELHQCQPLIDQRNPDDAKRGAAIEKDLELLRWFGKQSDGIAAQKFAPYLDFKKIF